MGQKMVASKLLESAFHDAGNISSSDPVPGLSLTTLLEGFAPGYGQIHKFLLFTFGFDVTVLVSLGVALWLGARIFRSAWTVIKTTIMAEITVSSPDEIHKHIIAFLAHHYETSSPRKLIAETLSKSTWELDSEEIKAKESRVDIEGNIKWLNFANQEVKLQPRFIPAIGSHSFWHNGTYFQLRRKEVAVFDELSSGAATFKDKELLTLSCFGRSTEPIKKLIQDAKEHYYQRHNAKTVIKRPAHKDLRKRGGSWCWRTQAQRPCRPMRTVVLEEEKKMKIQADINEYLNPAIARWYANLGIPYRRGYLLYGPPGTGKTSLTFALAGFFGLEIYVISLLDPTLTEEELEILFTSLPARCIVLLEDIDTAGLTREPSESEEKAAVPAGDEKGGNELNIATLAKALQRANLPLEEEKKKTISLSGLLNVVDGVASHEGRVLVMTTNHREKLDPALIRPGRVDHEVEFENATQKETQELFERIYTSSTTAVSTMKAKDVPNHTNGIAPVTGAALNRVAKHSEKEKPEEELSADDLNQIGKEFSEKVPEKRFSPAEIQGFLLKRKKDPRRALQEVENWVKEQGEKKGSK